MKTFNLMQGNSLELLKSLEDNSIDAIVTDPPYGLSQHSQGDIVNALTAWLTGEEYTHGKAGFMGKAWDSFVPSPMLFKECYRVLKHGGYILCFAGSRTQDLMSLSIRLAGFEIKDNCLFLYGSGFPKGLNIAKGIEKLGLYEEAKQWIGWNTQIKPAYEPIIMARKPLDGTVVNNVLKHGVGGLNIDACRISSDDIVGGRGCKKDTDGAMCFGGYKGDGYEPRRHTQGRYPANIILDGSDSVEALFPYAKSPSGYSHRKKSQNNCLSGGNMERFAFNGHGDQGSASRYFYHAKASKADRDEGLDSVVSIMLQYNVWKDTNTTSQVKKVQLLVGTDKLTQKVIGVFGTENKNAIEWNTMLFGSCTMEQFLKVNKFTTKTTTNLITTSTILNWLTHLLTKEYIADVNYEAKNGGSPAENVGICNTLTTTINEKMALVLGAKNVALGTQLKISVKESNNFHSTVKPTQLMRYLVKLVTPVGGVVLDPFMGSGSTGKACMLEGMRFIGMELSEEYVKIAEARIEHARQQMALLNYKDDE